MKSLLIAFGYASLLFSTISCTKENPQSSAEDFFFKAKFNGIEKNFSTKSHARQFQMNGKLVLSIVASLNNETSSITIWSSSEAFVANKTYGIQSSNCSNHNGLDYTSNQLSGHGNHSWGSVDLTGTGTEKFECRFTEVTPSYVRGKFSADLYKRQSGATEKISVTDGEFYVRLQ
jgi:hypothetical protein